MLPHTGVLRLPSCSYFGFEYSFISSRELVSALAAIDVLAKQVVQGTACRRPAPNGLPDRGRFTHSCNSYVLSLCDLRLILDRQLQ